MSSVYLADDHAQAAVFAAQLIKTSIRKVTALGLPFVLGTATGNTMVPVYAELVRSFLSNPKETSYSQVLTFGLDEYCGLSRDDPQSYWQFMCKHLFQYLDFVHSSCHLPEGDWTEQDCDQYEDEIYMLRGIDLQLLGIGRNGHIGFNEPGTSFGSRTRRVELAHKTRQDAVREFGSIEKVPTHAITMGIRTIVDSRNILVIACGANKAAAVAAALEQKPSRQVPASYLQTHNDVTWIIDRAAAANLSQTPFKSWNPQAV